jgi:hypothetical protein
MVVVLPGAGVMASVLATMNTLRSFTCTFEST